MKKQLLTTLLIICMLLPALGSTALATGDAAGESWSVTATVDGASMKASAVDGESYLFLPANADLTQLHLSFESMNHDGTTITWRGEKGSAGAGDAIDVTALAQMDEASRYAVEVVTKEGASFAFYIMQGASIPTFYLHSDDPREGRDWVDASKKHEATGTMEFITADGDAVYDGALTQIKARGNSTFAYYPKKPYQIKLDKKTDLLGNGEKGKTWVLLACYNDSTMMRDKTFKDLATELGMDYAIQADWVNLYYDGEYRGVYLLSEKVSVGSTGVDITDMEEAYEELNPTYGDDMEIAEAVNRYGQKYLYTKNITELETVTGGFLIEKNHDKIDEVNGFYTSREAGFNVKSPEWAGQEAMAYISEYYQEFENAVYATDEDGNYTGFNAETGKYYYEYCDLGSLMQTYLIQNLSQNVDAYASSFYFYKDADGIMYAGPVWDLDSTCGTGWNAEISLRSSHISGRYLAEALYKIPHFQMAVRSYFAYYFLPRVEAMLAEGGEIEERIGMLAPNAEMNFTLWPYIKVGNPEHEKHLWTDCTGYAMATEDLQTWLTTRVTRLKKNFRVSDTLKYFDDVTYGHWAYEAVCYATERGFLNGVTEENFYPNGTATRGMILTVLARFVGQDTTPAEGQRYYQPALDWAVAKGISDGRNPDGAISRQQLATMLWRCVGEPESEGSLDAFSDSDRVSAYAVDAMKWAVEEGIFRGDGAGKLNPTGLATRAHIAQVMMNFMTRT